MIPLLVVLGALVVIGDVSPRWQLDLDESWRAVPTTDTAGGNILAAYSRAPGWRLVVARQRGNTDAAYDGDRTFTDGLEEGVRRDTGGYKRLSLKQRAITGRKVKIPVVDLWYRTDGGVRGTRFVIMKGYAVMATIDLPGSKKPDKLAKKVLEGFSLAR